MCGIAGIVSRGGNNVIDDGITILTAQNNRGEQGCGAAAYDGRIIRRHCGVGQVKEVFGDRDKKQWSKLVGSVVVMHALYSTIDPEKGKKNQPKAKHPMIGKFWGESFALVHNGNVIRLKKLRKQAAAAGYKFQSKTSDSEVFVAMLSTSSKKDFLEALIEVCQTLESHGSFSLVIMFAGKLYGVRCGIRPLCIGKKHGKNGDPNSYIFASESCVFATLDATEMKRQVEHGELVVLGADGIENSVKWGTRPRPCLCSCCMLYFMKPSSVFSGADISKTVTVSRFRFECGRMSALKHPVVTRQGRKKKTKPDGVVPVPDSGRRYADGFAAQSRSKTMDVLEKNHYDSKSRSYMEDRDVRSGDHAARQRRKLQAIPGEMNGLVVCLTEDTLIRASVSPPVVKMSREYGGAREVHLRICSPRVCRKCRLGNDIRKCGELPAARMTTQEINKRLVHADSLAFLTVPEFRRVFVKLGLDPDDFCMGCFTGKYPTSQCDD